MDKKERLQKLYEQIRLYLEQRNISLSDSWRMITTEYISYNNYRNMLYRAKEGIGDIFRIQQILIDIIIATLNI